MGGSGVPLDEERQEAVRIVLEHDRAPFEFRAVWPDAGAGVWSGEGDLRVAQVLRDGADVTGSRGPANEAWFFHVADGAEPLEPGLCGIGRHDLEVALGAEGEQGIAGTFAGVGAARGSAHAGRRFDRRDRVREVAASGDDVVGDCVEWRACHDVWRRRGARVAGDTSMPSATTRPTTGQSVQLPPNQCCTAVYQSSVVGRKMSPRTGHSTDEKMPRNQLVANHSTTATNRGAARASRANRHGMSRAPLWRYESACSGALQIACER